MKKIYLLTILFCAFSLGSISQAVIKLKECTNESISKQVDSLKQLFAKDGFAVVKEASISMESEYEMPVIVPLQQGTWYQFVFIGDITSRLYEVRMYDWNERQVVYQQKKWGDVDGNIISYSYIPQFSEFHMIKPVQVNKKGVPFLQNLRIGKNGKKLDNDVTFRFDYSLRDDATANSKLDQNTAFGTAGQKVVSIRPSIDYILNNRINLKFYFEQNRVIPKIATSAPITTTRSGVQVRISLAQ